MHLATVIADAPGHLSRLLSEVAGQGANVMGVEHERWSPHLALGEVSLSLVLETRDADHGRDLVEHLKALGYAVEVIGSFRTKNFDN